MSHPILSPVSPCASPSSPCSSRVRSPRLTSRKPSRQASLEAWVQSDRLFGPAIGRKTPSRKSSRDDAVLSHLEIISKQLSALTSEVGTLSAALADKNKELAQMGALLTEKEAEIEESAHMMAIMKGELKAMKSQLNGQASREEKMIRQLGCFERRQMIVGIVDGDGLVPHKDLVAQRDGGAKAAGLLFDFIVKNAESRGYLDAKDRVLVLSFCNSAAFTNRVNDKTYKQNWSAFVTSWNSSGHNVHIIDATGRKEGADFHVNNWLKLGLDNPFVAEVYFAGAHDSAYVSKLRDARLRRQLEKLTVLHANTDVYWEIKRMKLRSELVVTTPQLWCTQSEKDALFNNGSTSQDTAGQTVLSHDPSQLVDNVSAARPVTGRGRESAGSRPPGRDCGSVSSRTPGSGHESTRTQPPSTLAHPSTASMLVSSAGPASNHWFRGTRGRGRSRGWGRGWGRGRGIAEPSSTIGT